MKLSFKSVFFSVLVGHTVGVIVLVLLSCTAMMLSYPSESVMLVGILSLALGSAFLGFYLRGQRCTLGDACLCGLVYAAIPFVLSLFLSGEGIGLGYRLILVAVTVMLSVLPSWLFRKKKKYRRVRR